MKCLICGTSRYVEECHIKPRQLGGKRTMFLCPNHHKLYDNHLLNAREVERLPLEAYEYYTGEKKLIKTGFPNPIEKLLARRSRERLRREIFGDNPSNDRVAKGIYELLDGMVENISIGLGGDRNGRE